MDLPCDWRDRELFAASTVVTIGNGKTASFWTSSWIEGQTPKNIAPNLFRKAKRKKISVHKALQNNRWIAHILPIHSAQEIREYVTLWDHLSHAQLEEDREDTITWRWTSHGEYTTKSAYQIQFEGRFRKLKLTPIWRAKAVPKCRFFAWTLLHKKILTANNLIKRNWPNDPICKLCASELETPNHLCLNCPFAKQVWTDLKRWLHLSVLNSVPMTGSIYGFWRKCRVKIDKRDRRKFDGVMIYFWWNL